MLRIICICEVCAKILCLEKELLNLKDSKLTQNFYDNKTGLVRPGHNFRNFKGHNVLVMSLLGTRVIYIIIIIIRNNNNDFIVVIQYYIIIKTHDSEL